MTGSIEPQGTVKALQNAIEVIDLVRTADDTSLDGLSERSTLARSTVYNHLKTLEHSGLIVKHGQQHQLGLKLLEYGVAARDENVDAELVQTSIDRLAGETEETAWFSVVERNQLVHVNRSMGERAITLGDRVGNHHQLHYYAAGKAILAHLPEKRARTLLEEELPARTEHTITDPETLFDELERIREQGVAYNDKEFAEGTRAVAAPVIVEERPIGAVALHGPTNRLHGDYFREELAQKVKACSNEIELKFIQRSAGDIFEYVRR